MIEIDLHFVGLPDEGLNGKKLIKLLGRCRSISLKGKPVNMDGKLVYNENLELDDKNDDLSLDARPVATRTNIFSLVNYPCERLQVLVLRYPLEEDYFAWVHPEFMDNDDGNLINRTKSALAVTTFGFYEISIAHGISYEKLLALNILTCAYGMQACLSEDKDGKKGNYFQLFTMNTEKSAFNFCKYKPDIVDSIKSGTIGQRAEAYLKTLKFSNKEIENLNTDVKRLVPDWFARKLPSYYSKPLLWAFGLTIFGAFLGAVLSYLTSPSSS